MLRGFRRNCEDLAAAGLVSVNGSPMLGGIEDKTIPPMTPGRRLVIEGSVIMGGVEISN